MLKLLIGSLLGLWWLALWGSGYAFTAAQTPEAMISSTPQLSSTATSTAPDVVVLPHFIELMDLNKACTSPCWWGFQVGVSKVSDFLDFLHKNGLDRGWEVESKLERPDSTGDGSGYVTVGASS